MPERAKVKVPESWGCPHCGSNEHVKQWDWIAASYDGAFGPDGTFEDDGNGAEVEWDIMRGGDDVSYVCHAPECPGLLAEWHTPKRIEGN